MRNFLNRLSPKKINVFLMLLWFGYAMFLTRTSMNNRKDDIATIILIDKIRLYSVVFIHFVLAYLIVFALAVFPPSFDFLLISYSILRVTSYFFTKRECQLSLYEKQVTNQNYQSGSHPLVELYVYYMNPHGKVYDIIRLVSAFMSEIILIIITCRFLLNNVTNSISIAVSISIALTIYYLTFGRYWEWDTLLRMIKGYSVNIEDVLVKQKTIDSK